MAASTNESINRKPTIREKSGTLLFGMVKERRGDGKSITTGGTPTTSTSRGRGSLAREQGRTEKKGEPGKRGCAMPGDGRSAKLWNLEKED